MFTCLLFDVVALDCAVVFLCFDVDLFCVCLVVLNLFVIFVIFGLLFSRCLLVWFLVVYFVTCLWFIVLLLLDCDLCYLP